MNKRLLYGYLLAIVTMGFTLILGSGTIKFLSGAQVTTAMSAVDVLWIPSAFLLISGAGRSVGSFRKGLGYLVGVAAIFIGLMSILILAAILTGTAKLG